MTNSNYIRHFKVLGKLAKLYDTASSDVTTLQTLLAAFVDQYATGTTDSIPAITLFPTYTSSWNAAITSGSTALQNIAKNAAAAYLQNANFYDDLATEPATYSSAGVLAALQTEMGAGVDNKTLTTKAATGLVNFFDAVLGSSGTWNTAVDGSADYKDSVYVVSTVV